MIIQEIRTRIAKKPYRFVIFRRGGGARIPAPPPSGSAYAEGCSIKSTQHIDICCDVQTMEVGGGGRGSANIRAYIIYRKVGHVLTSSLSQRSSVYSRI